MKRIKILLGVLLITTVSACATVPHDLIAEGDVQIAVVKSSHIYFSKVDVHKHGKSTEIEVVVRPIERERMFSAGSISVVVHKADGSQQKLVSDKARIDRHRIGSALQHAHFFIIAPRIFESGTKLTISYEPPA